MLIRIFCYNCYSQGVWMFFMAKLLGNILFGDDEAGLVIYPHRAQTASELSDQVDRFRINHILLYKYCECASAPIK